MALNDMLCRTAKQTNKRYSLVDRDGLYLEVMPTGGKYWRFKYRFNSKERRVTLGAYPKISLLEARKQRETIRDQVRNGTDPALVKLQNLQNKGFIDSPSFMLVAKEWHSKGIDTWDARYATTLMHRLDRYVFKEIGDYPIRLIKPMRVLACLQKIEHSAPDMARRIKQIISSVFKYAIATGRVEHDATYGLEVALKRYKKTHFPAIETEDLPDFLVCLYQHEARLYNQTFLLIKLMMLTFVRTGELINAKWAEFDLEGGTWVIPMERMKMRQPHIVPLSTQAVAILKELQQMNGKREYVFPSIPRPKKPMSNGTILVALKRMGYGKRMTGHGFRSLALGILKEKLNYSHEVADRQLAHAPKSTTDRAYDRAKFLRQRKLMMQTYADYLDQEYVMALTERMPV